MYKKARAEELWNICGSFGYVKGPVKDRENCISAENDSYHVCSYYTEDENGVIFRTGKFRNKSSHNIHVNYLLLRFLFPGGEYQVYTQTNSWQNESRGGWQPLITAISAQTRGLRNAYGAAPFFAIWNEQTGRGMAFHLLTKLPWHFEVRNVPAEGEANRLQIEAGVNPHNFSVELADGEELELPGIIFYEIRNKLDLDCYKIHHYVHQNYPLSKMPVLYNTWLYRFEKIDFANVCSQIQPARELGVEYFVVDGGWFGQGNFWDCRGDWFENEEVFQGRMQELSEKVRDCGMKFGLWLEIETAGPKARQLQVNREYYFAYEENGNTLYFFDFSNTKACEYLLETVKGLIEKYHVELIKFDFNQDLSLDIRQEAFRGYFRGYRNFLKKLKEACPNLYLENCASGGLRMCLDNLEDFHSFWLSDNQSPYEGMRIFKDTLRRMSPQAIEKWAAVQSLDIGHCYGDNGYVKIISTNDATWLDVRGVNMSYLKGFLTGSPVCFSCDLNGLSGNLFRILKDFVSQFKQDRDFWKTAVCRILADTESLLVLEYSDMAFEKARILIYTARIRQDSLVVYPKLDRTGDYQIDGKDVVSAGLIDQKGISVHLEGNFRAREITLERVSVETVEVTELSKAGL